MTTASESLRENPVNQSGSVALSTEAMRGPPWRNSLIIMALLTQEPGYEPGGRGFKSCRARQMHQGVGSLPTPHYFRGVTKKVPPGFATARQPRPASPGQHR